MTMEIGVTEINKKRIWKMDAQACIDHGCIETSRFIFMNATEHIKTKKSIWMRWAEMEMKYGTTESVDLVLQKVHETSNLGCNYVSKIRSVMAHGIKA